MKNPTRDLIRREIGGVKQRLRGRIVTLPSRVNFDTSGVRYATWVVAVDIGGNRVLENVPIKMAAAGSRSYARIGAPVWLEKDAGRYQVVAAADRAPSLRGVVLVDEDAGSSSAGGNAGFSFVREPFTYYKGDPAAQPTAFYNPAADAAVRVWLRAYDRALGAPSNISVVSDADGAQVITLTDKSGHGLSPTQGTAGNRPLYRRFASTGGNSNTLCTADFSGAAGQRLVFPSAVVEPSAGAISVFLLLNKDAAGAGDDIALELNHWRIYSRRAAGDTWGVDQGGGVVDSGRALTSTFAVLELVASAFNNFELFHDGTSLGTFAPAGAGLALGSSSLGGSATLGSHDGRVCELLVLDGAVTPTKRAAIEAYLNQAMRVAYSRWSDGVNAFPKVRVLDADGNEVSL